MFEKYVDILRENGPVPEVLKEIVLEHAPMKSKMMKNYERYKATKQGLPILNRKFDVEAANKINNQLANDWASEIVDTKTGYLFGNPVVIQLDREAQNYDNLLSKVERFRKMNNIDDLNGEIGKFMAIGGYDAGLLYIDREGQERVMRVDPWEVIIVSQTEISEPEFGIRYYTTFDDMARVDFYNEQEIISFESNSWDKFDEAAEVERVSNVFDYCPLFGIPNNAELQGDFDKVLTLIDAYDRAMSDVNSEIEQFRLAYMLFIGYAPDEAEIAQMIKTGALYIPESENGEDIKFLIKDLAGAIAGIDSHLDRLEANITRFAKHVNFTDEAFGGNLSGVSMRYKLFGLETKAKIAERKHEAAMSYMFKVLASAWKKKGINLDYTQVDLKYTRNVPVNVVDEATAATTLSAITSRKTALEQLSFINDVEAEMDRIEEERASMVDLDDFNDEEEETGGE